MTDDQLLAGHIRQLESIANLDLLKKLLRSQDSMNKKSILFVDNQAVVAIMAKNRSSSTQIQGSLRRLTAGLLAGTLRFLVAWVQPKLIPPMGLPVGLADVRFTTRDAKNIRIAEAQQITAENPKKCPWIFEDFKGCFENRTTLF